MEKDLKLINEMQGCLEKFYACADELWESNPEIARYLFLTLGSTLFEGIALRLRVEKNKMFDKD